MIKSAIRSTITNNVWYKSMLAGNLPSDYELIATVILSSAGTAYFSNIPQNYKHLQVRAATLVNGTSNGNYQDSWAFNSDYTGSNYSTHQLRGNGSSVVSQYYSTGMFMQFASFTSGTPVTNTAIFDVLDYSNTNKFKTARLFGGVAGPSSNFITLSSALWKSTAAISAIEYNYGGVQLGANSRVSLYGIRG
jgi:hypothetical protein